LIRDSVESRSIKGGGPSEKSPAVWQQGGHVSGRLRRLTFLTPPNAMNGRDKKKERWVGDLDPISSGGEQRRQRKKKETE